MNGDKQINSYLLRLGVFIAIGLFIWSIFELASQDISMDAPAQFALLAIFSFVCCYLLIAKIIKLNPASQINNAKDFSSERLTLMAQVFTDTREGIAITNNHGIIVDVNEAFCELTGYDREEIIGRNPRVLSSGKQSPEFYANMWKSVFKHGYWRGEVWNRKKNGELYAEQLTISVLKNDKNETTHYVGLFSDITQKKEQQEKLNALAHYDALTNLPNRSLFTDRFHQAIAHSLRTETQLAICFLDLDDFKPINDNFGHDVGDELLIEVGKRITKSVRKEDTVSRQGGDEFVMLLSDLESYVQCEQTIKRIQQALSLPFLIKEKSHRVSASIGIALYPSQKTDIDGLMRAADHAMYQAKLAGKHQYRLFDEEKKKPIDDQQEQLDEIKAAIINNDFNLFYQPKVNISAGKVFGFEALLRWNHPQRGTLKVESFSHLIEDTELEIKIGYWSITEVLKQLSLWEKQNIKLEVSINVSSRVLQDKKFYENLKKILESYPSVNSRLLQMEILESHRSHDHEWISKVVKSCNENLGITFAWDHFGIGNTSLTHLQNLSANTIKMDKNFIKNILDVPNDFAFIEGTIGLAEAFNRKMIAKGVTTIEQGLMLLIMGCENIQGSVIADPIPATDVPKWLGNFMPKQQWIDCDKQYKTTKDRRIKLLKLLNSHWQNRFEQNIRSSPKRIEHWPVIDIRYNHCGHWFKRARQECHFEQQWLDQLSMSYEKIHLIALFLLLEYQNECFDAARAGLIAFQNAFEEVDELLDGV